MKHFDSKDAFRSEQDRDPARRQKANGMGTVGCVCIDQHGHFAVAVSTGGTPFKKSGRVGDTPLWGSGGYTTSFGAAAATGYGEDLIRILISRQGLDFVEKGSTAQQAAEKTIQMLSDKLDGRGGIIIVGKELGNIGLAWNTPRMAFAYRTSESKTIVGISDKPTITFQPK